MQPTLARFIGLLALLSISFISCKKENDIIKPNPAPATKSNLYQFVIESLPGAPSSGTTGLYAQVMVVNEQNQTVLDNVKLPLQFDGSYKSSGLELPDGKFRVVKFLVNNEVHKTVFVAPITTSIKASQVSKPLYISFNLPQRALVPVEVEVLKREDGDSPESFGYPSSAFDQVDAPPPPDQGSPNFKIKIRPYFKIGDIMYDSIPTRLTVFITDNNGQVTTKQLSLAAGTNIVEVPKAATRYQFRVSKWGITDELILDKYQVHEESVYGIGGSRAAKKLKTELVYKLVNGAYIPESKMEYLYNASGNLFRINYYKKRSDGQTYLDKYDLFDYEQGRIAIIHHLKGNEEFLGAIQFTYDQDGRVKTMKQNENGAETRGEVTYYNIPGSFVANIKYNYSDHYYTTNYSLMFRNGNAAELQSATSHGSSEMGYYHYDFNINPYVHLKLPSLFLSYESKNNLIDQLKTYVASHPEAAPYTFAYTYDADGYPTQLISEYWAPGTNTRLYTLKTVYTYF